jgi:hypothetical protein
MRNMTATTKCHKKKDEREHIMTDQEFDQLVETVYDWRRVLKDLQRLGAPEEMQQGCMDEISKLRWQAIIDGVGERLLDAIYPAVPFEWRGMRAES